jgi:ABC-type lipoprotein release transport system permease subunit
MGFHPVALVSKLVRRKRLQKEKHYVKQYRNTEYTRQKTYIPNKMMMMMMMIMIIVIIIINFQWAVARWQLLLCIYINVK